MIISISGTPGVGKTTVVKLLGKELGANVISLNDLLKKHKIRSSFDPGRKTRVVDAGEIRKAVRNNIIRNKLNIVDGHLSYVAKSDIIFILRCRPDVLARRMGKKKWARTKIKENIDAEILDAITIDALKTAGKDRIVEIDTTKKTPHQTAAVIRKILNNHALQRKYSIGKIDWSEKFARYLIGN